MSWWIYKCNNLGHEHQRVWGDWDDLWANPNGRSWGTTDDIPALAELGTGDSVIAYQTNRNELVGITRVTQSCEADTHLYLRPVERIGAKVKPLKQADPVVARIPALQPGVIRTVYPISRADAERLLSAARGAATRTQPSTGADKRPRYWLFQIMEDRFPGLWQIMVSRGVAAQHYPEGWANVTRNVNRLRQLKAGDFVLAAFRNFRFGGHGRLETNFQRSGPSLRVSRPDGGSLAFRERFGCTWASLPANKLADCRALKEEGYPLALARGFAVSETTRAAFDHVVKRLEDAGAPLFDQTRVAATRAIDFDEPPPRVVVESVRVIRDTQKARSLKEQYEFACQICGTSIRLQPDRLYAEVHHLRPLGGEHRGPDVEGNMLVLCPNHHAAFDFGAAYFVSPTKIRMGIEEFPLRLDHQLSPQHVKYHNRLHADVSSRRVAT